MVTTIRPGTGSVLHRHRQIAGAGSVHLREVPEERRERDVETRIYTGTLYTRVFNCPKGEVATVLVGDLALGTVMPVVWGGVATSKPQDPRLQKVRRVQQSAGAMDQLIAEYLEINTR